LCYEYYNFYYKFFINSRDTYYINYLLLNNLARKAKNRPKPLFSLLINALQQQLWAPPSLSFFFLLYPSLSLLLMPPLRPYLARVFLAPFTFLEALFALSKILFTFLEALFFFSLLPSFISLHHHLSCRIC